MKSTFLQKKMRCVVGWLGVAVAAVLAPVSAAEIAFTGGSDGRCTDLSVAANWAGGVLPGAGDTGVVDYSTFSGDGALTVGSDLALGGLSFRNATAALTLSGEGTLSLGAAGLGVKNATALSLKLPIVVTAASTCRSTRERSTSIPPSAGRQSSESAKRVRVACTRPLAMMAT